jgi:hypothetical protein
MGEEVGGEVEVRIVFIIIRNLKKTRRYEL